MSIIGAQFVNIFKNSVLLLILIVLISIVPVLIAFDKFIPQKLYALAVIMIALALLYHRSLIDVHLTGADIHEEYYFANLVKNNFVWYSTIQNRVNAMLSIVMLAPICSSISGITLVWVFKIVYPSLYSIMPLMLYKVFQKQTNSKIAFMATFFFMSTLPFFDEMPSLARQEIAEIFLSLILLLIVSREISSRKKGILLVSFSASLVVSHYSLSYLFMCFMILIPFISFFMRKINVQKLFNKKKLQNTTYFKTQNNPRNKTIIITFTLLYCVLSLSWYMFISEGTTLNDITRVTTHIMRTFFTEFFNPETSHALNMLLRARLSPLHEGTKILHILMQFFISVGILSLMLGKEEKKFNNEYVYFSLVSFVTCIAAIVVPYLSGSLNTTRLYHITLIFLAPFCITGTIAFFKFISRILSVFSRTRPKRNPSSTLKVLSIILGIFLLFNTGFIYEVTKIHPWSISLSQNWVKKFGNTEEKVRFYSTYSPVEDVISAIWFSKHRDNSFKIYSDYRARNNVLNAYTMNPRSKGLVIYQTKTRIDEKSYVYFRKLNIIEDIMVGPRVGATGPPEIFNTTLIHPLLSNKANKIYSNGGSCIHYCFRAIMLSSYEE